MESGDCHGDYTAVSALIKAGISRVVIGMRYPLQHLRGKAIHTLRNEGLQVDVLGDIGSGSIESRLSPFAITRGQKEEEEEIKQDPLTELRYVWGLKGGGGDYQLKMYYDIVYSVVRFGMPRRFCKSYKILLGGWR
ncbi:putative 5-amino-6-(5-phosphoribosylamino)uracil reductase [Helianthus annuus]|uniref:5-amino-6-(5-phosphoribosylamino)uracil reductase n=1 Tax=Helianthus annuus TaxID=4232 RepID=A0A251T9K8_HELAN|nr:uncharacterized protein LOC110889603 [Helianthus annuus]KAF5780543.1 putative 5-amino-6-(5-phosphoribosylamino)uracil reductase [Helianthus annuus]KAJ0507753.1 putative 5-amino-6-(5-phosphoribosylamino)uracil reductase [Helianthus annuus]KAJ0516176.1 putative 5-amino-6-(5-phosphoribosylamino)uracil reductase [Helianthus annuus]KAJ0630607.1 putative 5-amino-6-(5-phosphoribosylamino)uracil reductase [Helianthus annuus]KAJ0684202.1 putative 5-amino-6-(5-phosphoribosylamino)uracil reductase [He